LATDVFVAVWDNGRRFFGLDLVELSVEDVLDAFVGDNASRQGAATGGLQAVLAVPLGQPEQTQAGAVGLLRMLARVEERLDELSGEWADGLRVCENTPVGRVMGKERMEPAELPG
jgi:hypothetical protein